MSNSRMISINEEKLHDAILKDKMKGIPDLEIGQKYGVTYKYIEKLITKSKGINVSSLNISKRIKKLEPDNFKEEQTTVWSFKSRGNWATHSGEYRGNWSPYIPRNIILKYSQPGEIVLDYFCGAGSTAVEAKLLERRCIAFDINEKAIELAKTNVNFNVELSQKSAFIKKNKIYEPELFVGDARNLSFLDNDSVDLICAHPPYANIIHYTDLKNGDLSFFDIDEFLEEMQKVAQESFRVLKPGKQCAILIGDTRRKKCVIPLGFKFINVYLNAGFKLKELVIKRQHNCKTTGFWYSNSIKYNFLLLAHEYLPIFEKPRHSNSFKVKETVVNYNKITQIIEKQPLKEKKTDLESSTVWIAPENIQLEEYIFRNVVDRYSKEKSCLTIDFSSLSMKENNSKRKTNLKEIQLLFITSSLLLSNNLSQIQITEYLDSLKQCIEFYAPQLNDGGFLVMQNRDVRINGYVEPLAKRIFELTNFDDLILKEIIVVAREEEKVPENVQSGLMINHQYLIVYGKINKIGK